MGGPSELLHDGDQPFIYDIRFSKKWFILEFYDTASPNQHWSTLKPDVVVLAFDISNRKTLDGLKQVSAFQTRTLFYPELELLVLFGENTRDLHELRAWLSKNSGGTIQPGISKVVMAKEFP